MQESTLYFVGALAWLTSVLTIGFGVYLNSRDDVQHMIDVVGGLASGFLWLLFMFGATSIETISSGIVVVDDEPGLAFMGGAFAVLMFIVAFLGTGYLLDVRDLARESTF